MTPERIEEHIEFVEKFGKLPGHMALELLAALEESQQLIADKDFDIANREHNRKLLQSELAEAQQTISRQQEAMDRASDMINHKHAAYRVLQNTLLPEGEGSDKA